MRTVTINETVYSVVSEGNTKVLCLAETGEKFTIDKSDLRFSLLESGELNEASASVSVVNKGVDKDGLLLVVNGKDYHYTSDSYTPKQLEDKFVSIAKHSIGKAFAWIKKNAKSKESYAKTKKPVVNESFDPEALDDEGGFEISLSEALESHQEALEDLGFYVDTIPDISKAYKDTYEQSWAVWSDYENEDGDSIVRYEASLKIKITTDGNLTVSYEGKFSGNHKASIKASQNGKAKSDDDVDKLINKVSSDALKKLKNELKKVSLGESVQELKVGSVVTVNEEEFEVVSVGSSRVVLSDGIDREAVDLKALIEGTLNEKDEEGDIKMVFGRRYVFRSGEWVHDENAKAKVDKNGKEKVKKAGLFDSKLKKKSKEDEKKEAKHAEGLEKADKRYSKAIDGINTGDKELDTELKKLFKENKKTVMKAVALSSDPDGWLDDTLSSLVKGDKEGMENTVKNWGTKEDSKKDYKKMSTREKAQALFKGTVNWSSSEMSGENVYD